MSLAITRSQILARTLSNQVQNPRVLTSKAQSPKQMSTQAQDPNNPRTLSTQAQEAIRDPIPLVEKVKDLVVIGGGLMGSGIAQQAAQTGHRVTVIEMSQDALNAAQGRINSSVQRIAKKKFSKDKDDQDKFIEETMEKLNWNTKLNEKSIDNADLVIEAVPEKLELKQEIFKICDEMTPEKTILATNTSSLSVNDIAKNVQRLDRVGGLHFFNPVPVMKLLEVVRTDEMSDETYKTLMNFALAIEKKPVTCKDTPGFIVNRLLVPFVEESVRILQSGIATAEDIDTAIRLGANHPMGPLELLDYTGLDTHLNIIKAKCLPGLTKPCPILEQKVKEGKTGRKAGEGFYKYNKI